MKKTSTFFLFVLLAIVVKPQIRFLEEKTEPEFFISMSQYFPLIIHYADQSENLVAKFDDYGNVELNGDTLVKGNCDFLRLMELHRNSFAELYDRASKGERYEEILRKQGIFDYPEPTPIPRSKSL